MRNSSRQAPYEGEISGYAKETVAATQNAGIIKRTGDGKLAPKNNATKRH
ncbi:MAG TPA: hypothetical protein GXX36_07245 [Clostridiaceae bacterium]|nr:hypothetical protein [Clostridiaceae bacterium]